MPNEQFVQLYHGKDNLHLIEVMMTMSALY